jgi:transposase
MRYGIDSLVAIIENRYHLPLFVQGTLLLFCGKKSNKLKVSYGRATVFFCPEKELKPINFSRPRNSSEAKQLPPTQFNWLMHGFSIEPIIHVSHPDISVWYFVQNVDFSIAGLVG